MAENAIRAYMDTAITTAVFENAVMMLTSGSGKNRWVKPTTGSTVQPKGILVGRWAPTAEDIEIDENGTTTLKRDISIYTLTDNPELEAVMKTGATSVVADDYIMAAADGYVDKWVTGSSNIKLGQVLEAAAAGERVKFKPVANLGAIA